MQLAPPLGFGAHTHLYNFPSVWDLATIHGTYTLTSDYNVPNLPNRCVLCN